MTESLGSILVKSHHITAAQLSHALRRQGQTGQMLGDVLVDLGYATRDTIARGLALQLGIPFQELGEGFQLRPDEVKLLPEAVVRRFGMLALRPDKSARLLLVMRDPLDLAAVDTARTLTRLEVHKAISTEDRIREVIERHFGTSANIERRLQNIAAAESAQEGAPPPGEGTADSDTLAVQANDAPVVQFVNLLLLEAAERRASDIHFEPGEEDVGVRLRIDGVLRPYTAPPRRLHPAIVTRIKILANMDIAERRLPLDGRFKFRAGERVVDVRVSSLPEVHGEKMVLRLLDRASLVLDMGAIGFEDALRDQFQRVLRLPHGIVLLTGPTGSGKTTTLYSALHFLRSPEVNIQTVEDPVEYQIPGINQMAIKPAIGLGFADALRAILRQDPDIVMVGEIRDRDTADIAMRASLTGHLVLSTLHTNDAPAAITRLEDIGVERYLVAATVRLVIAQRLVRLICGECRQPAELAPEDARVVAGLWPEAAGWPYQAGAGCAKCEQCGYRGRTAVLEFLELTEPLRAMVAEGAGEAPLRERAQQAGMRPLIRNGLEKARRGLTTVREVLEACAAG